MKKTFLLLILLVFKGFYSNSQFSLPSNNEAVSDSIRFFDRLFTVSPKKNTIFLDLELGVPGFTYGIGYMRQNKFMKYGFRFGGWKSKAKFAPPSVLLYRVDLTILPRIYKSLYGDINFGYLSAHYFSPKQKVRGNPYLSLGLRLEVYQHFFIRSGFSVVHDLGSKSNLNIYTPYVAIGGQFNF